METNRVPTASQAKKKVEKILDGWSVKAPQICPVRDVLHEVTDKWSMLAIMVLGKHTTLRFNELKTEIRGVSQKMLTVTMKKLEKNGLVTRKVYPQIPPKVEYTITPMGMEFLQNLTVMLDWACVNSKKIGQYRKH
jgi:DNA-binding HxlR family transcriptional regulator